MGRESDGLWGCGLELAGAVVLGDFFYEKVAGAGDFLLLFLARDADAVAGLDGEGVADEGVGLLVAFVEQGEAAGAGGCASGKRGRPANEEVDAYADCGTADRYSYENRDDGILQGVCFGRRVDGDKTDAEEGDGEAAQRFLHGTPSSFTDLGRRYAGDDFMLIAQRSRKMQDWPIGISEAPTGKYDSTAATRAPDAGRR